MTPCAFRLGEQPVPAPTGATIDEEFGDGAGATHQEGSMDDRGLDRLERAVADLRAREDIRELVALYHRGCDGGWDGVGTHQDPTLLAGLFTEDAVYRLSGFPPAVGRAEIVRLLTSAQALPWVIHYAANHELQVDIEAGRATGRVKGAMAYFRDGVTRTMVFGSYHGRFERVAGRWLFAEWDWRRSEQPDGGGRPAVVTPADFGRA